MVEKNISKRLKKKFLFNFYIVRDFQKKNKYNEEELLLRKYSENRFRQGFRENDESFFFVFRTFSSNLIKIYLF